jgi:HK97 family phage portal protein
VSLLGRIARGGAMAYTPDAGTAVELEPWIEAFRSAGAAAGKTVTIPSALGVAAVWAAVRVLSDTIGTLPLVSYRRQGEDRARAPDSRQYRLLHDQPNPEMSASTCWRLVAAHMNTWGNAYLGKTFRGGQLVELWPIRPDRVRVSRKKGMKVFELTTEKGDPDRKTYTSKEILHLYGLSLDGMSGLSPVSYARESIGAALAMDEYSNSFFRAGALPRMVLKSKKQLSKEAKNRLREQWESKYGGSKNANRVAVLEEDIDVDLLSLPQKDVEFVEQRKHSVQEIARWFRVPVSLIEGDKGGSLTYSTVEGDAMHFVTHSVRPWLVAIEDELNRDLDLFPSNRLFCEFLVDELLRADTASRANTWHLALDPVSGWMTPAEVRQRENLPADSSFDSPTKPPPPTVVAPAPEQAPVPAPPLRR